MIDIDSYNKASLEENALPTIPESRLTPIYAKCTQIKKTAKVKRIYEGRVVSVEENLFTAVISKGDERYRMRILKRMLSDGQREELVNGAEFEWIVRHDYRKNRNATRVEIQFKKKYSVSEATLRRLMDDSAAKYGHMFRDED